MTRVIGDLERERSVGFDGGVLFEVDFVVPVGGEVWIRGIGDRDRECDDLFFEDVEDEDEVGDGETE